MSYSNSLSTYVKPLFIFGTGTFIFIFEKIRNRKSWSLIAAGIFFYAVSHLLMFYIKDYSIAIILKEFKFLINLLYFLATFFIVDFLIFTFKDEAAKYLTETIFNVSIIFIITISVGCNNKCGKDVNIHYNQ